VSPDAREGKAIPASYKTPAMKVIFNSNTPPTYKLSHRTTTVITVCSSFSGCLNPRDLIITTADGLGENQISWVYKS
jgi:hypothetical protein